MYRFKGLCLRSVLTFGVVAVFSTAAWAGQVVYTSLPLPVPDTRAADLIASAQAETTFFAALSSKGTETLDGFTGQQLGFTATQNLAFGATGITAVARYSGAFQAPPFPVSGSVALVLQPPSTGPAYANDMTFNTPITAFGSYIIQAGDAAANTITLRLENTLLNTSKDVVMGTVGPTASALNVFYFGITDTDPFNRVTLLPSNQGDGILLDNITAGIAVPEPSTLAMLATVAGPALLGFFRRKRATG